VAGQSRKRDPKFLASQDLVVTTYTMIGKDATYWAKKSGFGYVPPLEKVAWHRVGEWSDFSCTRAD
jgi:hypothetical protein